MAEGSGSNTAIWVAVITVVGSLLTAVIVNADKWMAKGEKPAFAAAVPTPAPTHSVPLTPTPTPTTAPAAATPSPEATATETAPDSSEASEVSVNLHGEWRDSEGIRVVFEQTGAQFSFMLWKSDGMPVWHASGEIKGRDLVGMYDTVTGKTGRCNARVNAEETRISGACVPDANDRGWKFVFER